MFAQQHQLMLPQALWRVGIEVDLALQDLFHHFKDQSPQFNVAALQPTADRLKGQRVTITGRIRIAHYIERGDVRTLDAATITPVG